MGQIMRQEFIVKYNKRINNKKDNDDNDDEENMSTHLLTSL